MKHIFIVNPKAGKGQKALTFQNVIQATCEKFGLDYEIYITQEKYGAINFVKERAAEGNPVRFYACGGDGTLYEVVNGAVGFENAQITVVPLGSGNDFVRYFGGAEGFLDLESLIHGQAIKIDLIKCGDRYSINQCAMGLDAEIGGMQNKFKAIPLLSAAGAYYPAIIYGILRKIKNVFSIRIDDGNEFTQPCLFCVAANSRWYGGGYFSAPMANPTDGILDFIIVKKTLNRFQLLPLISKYKAGQHLDWDFTRHESGRKLSIRSEKPAAVNLDGEVFYANEAVFEVIPECMNFVIPAK